MSTHLDMETALPIAAADLPQDDEIDLGEYVDALIDARWLIIGITAAVLAIGLMYALTARPIYAVDALLQVEGDRSGMEAALGSAGLLLGSETAITGELEILRSRSVLGRVVANLGLDIQAAPQYLPLMGEAIARRRGGNGPASPLLGLSRYGWGGERIAVDSFEVPASLRGASFTLRADGNGTYALSDPGGTPVLTGQVGERAHAQFAGGSLSLFVSELKGRPGTHFDLRRVSELAAINNLRGALSASERGRQSFVIGLTLEGPDPAAITRTLNEIGNLYVRQNVERRSAEAAKTLEFLELELPRIKQQMETAEAGLNAYRMERGSVDLPRETQVILDRMVATEGQLIELQQRREELVRRFTPEHPQMLAVEAQVAALRRELDELNNGTRSLPSTQQEVLRLARDVQVSTELYTGLLNNSQALQVARAGTIGNVRIIDHAMLPGGAVKPQRSLIAGLSLILGVLLGVAAALLRRAFSSGIEDPDLIERKLGLPVYATVPHSRAQEKLERGVRTRQSGSFVLANDEPQDLSVESLRGLRTTLHFALMESKNNVLMITGPSPGIGKSFVMVNLAVLLAQSGKKVLMVDADLRRGYIHQYLGKTRDPGLSDFISGSVTLEQIMQRGVLERVDFISAGSLPPNPSELLLHERFAKVLEQLSARYDVVLLDSPPVLAVADAAILGQLAGAALMVLRSGEHTLREIEVSLRRMKQAGVKVPGAVFNDVPLQKRQYGMRQYEYGALYYAYRQR